VLPPAAVDGLLVVPIPAVEDVEEVPVPAELLRAPAGLELEPVVELVVDEVPPETAAQGATVAELAVAGDPWVICTPATLQFSGTCC